MFEYRLNMIYIQEKPGSILFFKKYDFVDENSIMAIINYAYHLGNQPEPLGCNFHLMDTGRLRCDCSFRFGGYCCWHIVATGNGYVECGGQRYHLKRGDIFSVMQDTEIEYGPRENTTWELYYLRIGGEKAVLMTESIGLTEKHPVLCGLHPEETLSMFKNLWRSAKDNALRAEFFAAGILQIVDLLTKNTRSAALSDEEIVREAHQVMENPLNRGINVNELAAALRISRSKLFLAFKRVTNESPHQVLCRSRVEFCCKLLQENPDLTLTELSRKMLFSSDKYFIKFFKDKKGITPNQFRHRQKNS